VTAPSAAAPLAWPSARTLAAGAALAVAVAGRGDLLFLGGLLAIALADRRSSTAAALAVAAVAVRWGTTSAERVTGALTTLGPGVRVGPPQAAAALGLAALALLLAGARAPLLPRLATGVTAGAVAVGPIGAGRAGSVVLGVLGVALGAALALALPSRLGRSDRWLRLAPAIALVALALAALW
jgi:hypothetical protein